MCFLQRMLTVAFPISNKTLLYRVFHRYHTAYVACMPCCHELIEH